MDHRRRRARRSGSIPHQDLPGIPLVEAAAHGPPEPVPSWRGWTPLANVPVVLAAGTIPIIVADGPASTISAAVFAATSLLLFGISAAYHRIPWAPKTKAVFPRLDHANIYLLNPGTYTPLAVNALPWPKNAILLGVAWGGALLGIAFRIFWLQAPRWLYVGLYLALGWAALVYAVDLFQANATSMILVLAGGIAYTAGAVFYALKRPNPWPGRFGFHEVFHSCTVGAFLCHWTANLLVTLNPLTP
ncbi:hemolysin III family protein [Arthrobacter deserti]|uniref:Hemolysin III family protein n=1 Tax=Arthrobacter deserti TaxID=1742687 RepID=A0ABX1JIZ4_9MICC|nr:hemolysin III family protein [Arthrobacter deserti]